MTTTTPRESAASAQSADKKPRLGGLFAEFAKLSPSLEYECSEDEARHRWATEVLKKPVTSWNALTQNEVNRLIKVARRQSGNSPLNDYIPEAALELWGHDWDAFLAERIRERFGSRKLEVGNREKANPTSHPLLPTSVLFSLKPREKAALFEELCSRLARNDGRTIEAVKHDIMGKVRSRRHPQISPIPPIESGEPASSADKKF